MSASHTSLIALLGKCVIAAGHSPILVICFSLHSMAAEVRLSDLENGAPRGTEPVPRRPLKLFLLVGQSNMAGRGSVGPDDRKPIPGVWSFDRTGTWVQAIDPLHWDKPEIAGVGLGRSFAQTLRTLEPGVEIGLIPCAFGGTALEKWMPGGDLFIDAVDRARRAMADGELCGILWHQGETDTRRRETAVTYAERWRTFMSSLRAELKAESVPVVVGGLGEFVAGRMLDGAPYGPFLEEVNRQIGTLASSEGKIVYVDATGLGHIGDQLHFSADAQHELGRRYARAFLKLQPTWPASSNQRKRSETAEIP